MTARTERVHGTPAAPRRVYKCAQCRKQFSVLIGTIFEGTKIPLYKWLMAIQMAEGKRLRYRDPIKAIIENDPGV